MLQLLSVVRVATRAFANLKANDPIRMAAATAFFSFFALPAIAIILSRLFGGLVNQTDHPANLHLFAKLAELLGNRSASRLEEIAHHLEQRRSSRFLTGLSVVVLLLASTTLFTIIRSSLNQLWSVRIAANRRWRSVIWDKAIAFGIILFLGFLMTLSLMIPPVVASVSQDWLSTNAFSLFRQLGRQSLSIGLVTLWLAVVFKYLPDIRIRWRAVWVGSAVTSVLIELGERTLTYLLVNSSVRTLYGSSGDLILVLLFVFYCSLIFYYGACFTRSYSEWTRLEVRPGSNAVAYQITEIPD